MKKVFLGAALILLLMVFAAAVAEGPSTALIDAMSELEKVNAHCSAEGAAPPLEICERLSESPPPDIVEPLERVSKTDCASTG